MRPMLVKFPLSRSFGICKAYGKPSAIRPLITRPFVHSAEHALIFIFREDFVMELLNNYLPRIDFDDYEDFKQNFTINVPERFDFARDIVDGWARLEPDKRALLYTSDSGEARGFTFSEISELSKRAAAYFISLGIKKGDRVFTLLRRRWEYWICAVALHRIGAVVVPGSVQLTEKDIFYRIYAAQAKLLIAVNDSFVIEQIKNLPQKCASLSRVLIAGDSAADGFEYFNGEFMKHEPYNEPLEAVNSDEMVIYFTSGTSGMPKMAIHNRTYPLGHIVTAKYMQCVQNNGLHITQADSGWAKFGWGNIYGQWICGSAVLAYDPLRFNAAHFLETTEKYKPTSMCIPPTMYRFLLRDGLEKKHIASVKWFSTAGEPLSGEVNSRFHEITGHYIHEGFGQSEGTPITCGFPWVEVRPSSMGKPSPLYHTAIIRPDGSPCGCGEEGEVVIFTDGGQLGLLDCYFADGEKIYPVKDGIYHTGDTAYCDKDGYYWYVGRTDDVIKSSGYRIGPFEIESVLNSHPAIRESAIIGQPDEMRGQIVCAVVALSNGYEPSDELTRELKDYVKRKTAPYKYPRIIKYIDTLPKTTSGKIIRNAVKKIYNTAI